jgi:hypothetical protein
VLYQQLAYYNMQWYAGSPQKVIFQEANETPYSIHPGNTKMYMDLKERYWWNNMKRDIA